MKLDAAFLLWFLLLSAISVVWIIGLSRQNRRDWSSICREFSNSNGLVADSGSTDTSLRFEGKYCDIAVKLEVVLSGGWEAAPPVLTLQITATDIGRAGDRFEIRERRFLSKGRYKLGVPRLDKEYILESASDPHLIHLFLFPWAHDNLLDFHPNALWLANNKLIFSKRVTEADLEKLAGYMDFVTAIGKQIDQLQGIRVAEQTSGMNAGCRLSLPGAGHK